MKKQSRPSSAKAGTPRKTERGAPATAAQPGQKPRDAAAKAGGPGEPKTRGSQTGGTAQPPPPGLDATKHAAAQRTAQRAEMLRDRLFSTLMGDALGYEKLFDGATYQVYLEDLIKDAGSPTDPVERMMLEQLALAHFRVAQLHTKAGHAQTLEGEKVYNSLAARLLGEFRRTALSLRAYQARTPEDRQKNLKIFKAAQ